MDQALSLRVLCYLTGRIASPVGAYVITITILRWNPSLGFSEGIDQYGYAINLAEKG